MVKIKTTYFCQNCGAQAAKFIGPLSFVRGVEHLCGRGC